MKISAIFAGLAALAVLGACATATPYQQATESQRGYDQQQIEDNRWTVTFSGNSLTDRETVETYLLYRAAELTQQQGFDHFRVADTETDEKRRVIASPSAFYDPFYSSFYCDYRFYGRRGRLYPTRFGPTYYRSRSPFYSSPFHRSQFSYYDPFWGGGYDYREITRYDATAEIIMGSGTKPDDASYFDASQVLSHLAGRITRPEV